MLMGMPLLLAIALLAPGLWILSAGWIAGVSGIVLMDGLLGARLRAYEVKAGLPPLLYVGERDTASLKLRFATGPLPERIEIQLETNEFIPQPDPQGLRGWDARERHYEMDLSPGRRGWRESFVCGAGGADRWGLSRSGMSTRSAWTFP